MFSEGLIFSPSKTGDLHGTPSSIMKQLNKTKQNKNNDKTVLEIQSKCLSPSNLLNYKTSLLSGTILDISDYAMVTKLGTSCAKQHRHY